jgi:tetratricopeptide (TPR) repeat protein
MRYRATALLLMGLLGFAVCPPLGAVETSDPPPPPPQPSTQKPSNQPASTNTKRQKPNPGQQQQQQLQQQKGSDLFLEGYKSAHAMIYRQRRYEAGIAKLRSLGRDDHPDVANLIGFASRKLGRYEDARYWYEKALAADPKHARTWSYYGMWHAEQGNLLKARDHLAVVQSICGTRCREYVELKGVIEGTRLY